MFDLQCHRFDQYFIDFIRFFNKFTLWQVKTAGWNIFFFGSLGECMCECFVSNRLNNICIEFNAWRGFASEYALDIQSHVKSCCYVECMDRECVYALETNQIILIEHLFTH